MNKNKQKIVFILVGAIAIIVLGVMASLLFVGPKISSSKIIQKNFPVKAADILPTLPAPKSTAINQLAKAQIVFVPRVIDGDTIVVEPVDPTTGEPGKQETIRYIGMDTPETVSPTKPVECYGHEASARNKELVDGKYVAIVADAGDKDKYGRLLRYIYLLDATNTFVNLELVKEGFARTLTIPPNTEFADELKAAASTAQSAKLGFWGACATYPFQ